eukprot:TRINITY_DN17290_c0_g1_i3.p1 TRINITY_DN17290_c0_g1~~TRINITY_DN17290_c0_g1_i3.p1  ORF type:complete len:289 (-),score=61.14 TRINITY_DN17290_c0_g1_i3:224-1090(-)
MCIRDRAGGDIGAATVARLCAVCPDCTVFACDVAASSLGIWAGNHQVLPCVVDLTDRVQLEKLVHTVEASCGPEGLDGLVQIAGVLHHSPLLEATDEEIRAAVEVNTVAPIRLMRELCPLLLRGGSGGRIINISSLTGRVAWPWTGAYSASKHALRAATDTVRREAVANCLPLTVVLIEPGPVDTRMASSQPNRLLTWCHLHPSSPWQPAALKSAQFAAAAIRAGYFKTFGRLFACTAERVGDEIVEALVSPGCPQTHVQLDCGFMYLLHWFVSIAPVWCGDMVMARI